MLQIDPSAEGPVEVLKSEDMMRTMTLYAASALAKLGLQGQQLTERVLPLLKDNNWQVREAARIAMKQIDPLRAMALMISV